ncbi:MAG: hypothetical protein COA62_15655 [Rhodobiaceae bacterium]|nr:MAG: hypothetical protein COA62_15655 [Rhodobiaceae bacterium]
MAYNSSFSAATSLRALVVDHLRLTAQRLPQIRALAVNAPVPAIVLVYDLYEDTDREDELIDRNLLQNPLFVPTNRNLEVASK